MNFMQFVDVTKKSEPTDKAKVTWQNYIHSDPNILHGKPVVKGTRLAIDFILQLLAQGWTPAQVLENYPNLPPEALQAIFIFAIACIQDDRLYKISSEKTEP